MDCVFGPRRQVGDRWALQRQQQQQQHLQHAAFKRLVLPFLTSESAIVCQQHTGSLRHHPHLAPIPAFQLQFSHEKLHGQLLAVVDEEGMLSLIDTRSDHSSNASNRFHELQSQTANVSWLAHENAIFDVTWSVDDQLLLTASGDAQVRVWDAQSQRLCVALNGHEMSVKSVRQMAAQPNVLASCSRDGKVLLWDLRTPTQPVQSLAGIHQDYSKQKFGSHTGHMNQQRRTKRRRLFTSSSSSGSSSVTCIEFFQSTGIPDTHQLLTAGATDGFVKLWDLRSLRTSGYLGPGGCYSESVAMPVQSIDCANGKGHRKGISSMSLDPATNSKLLVTTLNDTTKCFHLPTGKSLGSFEGNANSSFFVKSCWSPDGDFVLGGSGDHQVYLWDAAHLSASHERHDSCSCSPSFVLKGHQAEVNGVAWCRTDTTKLASCSDDGTVRVWRSNRSQEDLVASRFVLERKHLQSHDGWSSTPPAMWTNLEQFCQQEDGLAYSVKSVVHYEEKDLAICSREADQEDVKMRTPLSQQYQQSIATFVTTNTSNTSSSSIPFHSMPQRLSRTTPLASPPNTQVRRTPKRTLQPQTLFDCWK